MIEPEAELRHRKRTRLFRDTDPEVERLLIDRARELSPRERLERVARLNRDVRRLARRGLELRDPAASADQIQRRLADLLLGEALAGAAYGPHADG